MLVEEKKVEC